jgi:divalent metal cation (Fe/Co/Zn/Cd) transporter
MSTSPDTPKGAHFPVQAAARILRSDNPVLILLRGLLWVALIVTGITLLVMNYDIVWQFLAEVVPLLLEVAEEALDTFFESVVRLNPVFAQMATAYTGFVVLLVALYFLSRKGITVYQHAKIKKSQITEVYANAWTQICDSARTSFQTWWDSLDSLNKVVAMVAFVLLGIPLALLLSFVLGSLVAQFL